MEKAKCEICGQEYRVYDPEDPQIDKRGVPFRNADEWNEQEVLAHKLKHVSSAKVRRVLGSFYRLSEEQRKQFLAFFRSVK